MSTLPLSDTKVVDLTRLIAGPACTRYLADFGASVTKIEPFPTGDEARLARPVRGSISGLFAALNRNKRSIVLNLNKKSARDIVLSLVKDADVFVENFATGVVGKFGLDYDTLRQINPGLIYCSISAFGRTGPMGRAPGFELSLQAYSGLMSVTGTAQSGPLRVGFSPLDHTTGYHAAMGILAALRHKDRTGEGQLVHASLLETALNFLTWHVNDYWLDGRLPVKPASGHPGFVPYQAFDAKDGEIIIAIASENLWQRFCKAIGEPGLETDERFRTNVDRVANREHVERVLGEIIGRRTVAEWSELFDASRIPYSPVNGIVEAVTSPQVTERGLVMEYAAQDGSMQSCLAAPVALGAGPGENQVRLPPPLLGEHTDAILSEIGLTGTEIGTLREDEAIV